jgi:hypothetical protein
MHARTAARHPFYPRLTHVMAKTASEAKLPGHPGISWNKTIFLPRGLFMSLFSTILAPISRLDFGL